MSWKKVGSSSRWTFHGADQGPYNLSFGSDLVYDYSPAGGYTNSYGYDPEQKALYVGSSEKSQVIRVTPDGIDWTTNLGSDWADSVESTIYHNGYVYVVADTPDGVRVVQLDASSGSEVNRRSNNVGLHTTSLSITNGQIMYINDTEIAAIDPNDLSLITTSSVSMDGNMDMGDGYNGNYYAVHGNSSYPLIRKFDSNCNQVNTYSDSNVDGIGGVRCCDDGLFVSWSDSNNALHLEYFDYSLNKKDSVTMSSTNDGGLCLHPNKRRGVEDGDTVYFEWNSSSITKNTSLNLSLSGPLAAVKI